MKKLTFTLFFLMTVLVASSQGTKIKVAESYYASFRFADADPIYQELIFKDKLAADKNLTIYRHAAQTALRLKDYWLALKYYEAMQKAAGFEFEDAYQLFMLNNFLGRYEKLDDLLSSPVLANGSGAKKDLLQRYANEKPWIKLMADSTGSSIEWMKFNSPEGDFGPVLVPGGLAFSSNRNPDKQQTSFDNAGFLDQYHFDFKTGAVTRMRDLRSKRHDGASFYDSTARRWFVSKNLPQDKVSGITKTGIFIYNEKTDQEVAFSYNNASYFVAQPYYDISGQRLFFSSDMPGGYGGADLWMSAWNGSSWEKPVNLGATINTHEDEMFPYLHDGVFYFSSEGHPGLGGLDVFSSQVQQNNFERPVNMGYPLNSFGDDLSLVLLADGENGYYTAGRRNYAFVDQLYRFKLLNTKIMLHVKVIQDYKDQGVMPDQLVLIKDENNQVIDSVRTNDQGEFDYPLKKNTSYNFEVRNDRFDDYTADLNTFSAKGGDTLQREFLLNPKYVAINSIARDKNSGQPLANTTISFKSKTTGQVVEVETDENGRIRTELPRNQEFDVVASKKGYIDDLKALNTTTKEKELHNEMDLDFVLDKFKAGTTIQVENVFYDLNKANLRPESKVELDKLAEFLLKNDNIQVELSSHTDSRGSDAKNMALSQARAQSCVDYLLTKGINPNNIVAKGYGESKIINRCKNGVKCSEAEHQLNRRTEIKILSVRE